MNKKVLVYIVGAGRSGTTITGIMLGVSDGFFHAGEINKFYEYKGVPHGFKKNGEAYTFYQNIYRKLTYKNNALTRKFEYHASYLRVLFGLFAKKEKRQYEILQRSLFDSIAQKTKENIIIDSSKYPGRVIALNRYTNYDIRLIYIVRHPLNYLKTVKKKKVEQPAQGLIFASLYYFIINLMCITSYKNHKGRKIKIRYEDLVKNPIVVIEKIEKSLNLSFSLSKEYVKYKKPMQTGHIFEGNRIRLQNKIIFHTKSTIKHGSNIKNSIMMLLNRWFY